jgi:uncharacterized protein YkwD
LKNLLFNFFIFFIILTLGCGGGADSGGTLVQTPASISQIEIGERNLILSLTNDERRKAGIPELIMSEDLNEVAQLHAVDMTTRNYFNHVNPEGEVPWDRMSKYGLLFSEAGENIAFQLSSTNAVTGWMGSPAHKAGMLDPKYTKIGIGVSKTGDSSWANYVQDFSD